MTRKADKPTKVQSAVYKNIRWDFSEVADELEKLRLEHAPDTERNERFPLSWIPRADQRFTLLLDERDGKRPITRAFEACGVMTGIEISNLARYQHSSTVSRWDVRTMTADVVQEHLFPALCDAYCIARKQHPNFWSATFTVDDNAFINGDRTPEDEDMARFMLADIKLMRQGIEREAVWVLIRGGLDSYRGIDLDTYIETRTTYRRTVALYAALLLNGGELGDLAHVAAALVAQHIAAHGNESWGEHDNICLSSKRNKLDFTADRWEESEHAVSLHVDSSTGELVDKGQEIARAMLRYVETGFLRVFERAIHAELERRSKIGPYYLPELHAETEPTDEDEPST